MEPIGALPGEVGDANSLKNMVGPCGLACPEPVKGTADFYRVNASAYFLNLASRTAEYASAIEPWFSLWEVELLILGNVRTPRRESARAVSLAHRKIRGGAG